MWFIVVVVAWFALGYLGARYCFQDTEDAGLAGACLVFGPIGAAIAGLHWLDNRPQVNRKNFWRAFYNIKDKR